MIDPEKLALVVKLHDIEAERRRRRLTGESRVAVNNRAHDERIRAVLGVSELGKLALPAEVWPDGRGALSFGGGELVEVDPDKLTTLRRLAAIEAERRRLVESGASRAVVDDEAEIKRQKLILHVSITELRTLYMSVELPERVKPMRAGGMPTPPPPPRKPRRRDLRR
ncbi:MAG: hypothetical protein WC329_06245 [Candidatus Omnitrophota bacterium]|jgi:hypothetical protein